MWLLFGYQPCATVMRDPRLSSVRPASVMVAVSGDALAEFDDLVEHMQRWLLLRDAPRHLAFGGDAHVCLGSTLARLEGRLSISALIRRFPGMRLADEQPDWGPNFAFRGLNTLHVRV